MFESYITHKISSIVFIFIWLILYLISSLSYDISIGYCSSVFLIFISIWLIIRALVVKNTIFTVFFSFIFLYSLPPYTYYFKEIYLSAHNQEFTYETTNQVNLIFSLFLITINFFLKIPSANQLPKLRYRSNNLLYICIYVLSLLIVITKRRQGNVYSGLIDDEASMSSINEYVIILFAILIIYSNRNLLYTWMNAALFTLYAFFALIAGGRIEIVLLFMLLFVIRFSQTISFRKTIILFMIGAWSMSIFGNIRSNPSILFSSDIMEIINPFKEKEYIMNSLNNNEGDVYWASERMILLEKEGYLPWDKRIISGFCFFSSVILPSSIMPEEAILSQYRQDIKTTGGGGLAPVYLYIFMGIPGVILLGWFVANILNGFKINVSDYRYFYTLFFITTSPRWIAYTPSQIIKLCVWAVIIYYIMRSIDFTIKNNSDFNKL